MTYIEWLSGQCSAEGCGSPYHGLPSNDSGPEVGLWAITTPSGVFQPEFVVHCLAESLLAAEITFGGLNRCVSKQELNLLDARHFHLNCHTICHPREQTFIVSRAFGRDGLAVR
jgi:hypothetical protein